MLLTMTRALLLFVLCFLVACSDLDEHLVGEVTDDIIVLSQPITVGDPPAGPYSRLQNLGFTNHGGYFTLQEVTSDAMFVGVKGSDWNSDGALIRLHQHSYTPANFAVANAWDNFYTSIAFLNEYMGSSWALPQYIPEAKALRAFHYLHLLDLFGRVKLVTDENPDAPQATRTEVFEFVEREFLEALGVDALSPSLDFSSSPLDPHNNVYRVGPHAVLGFLAKLYLNAEVYTGEPHYEEAALAASLIIDSGQYQLCGEGCSVANLGRRHGVPSDPKDLEGYAAVFAPNNEQNPEHIFSIFYDELAGTGMYFSQMNLHYASQRSWSLAEQPWNGYATLEEFYNSYDDQDLRKGASFLAGVQLDFSGSAILDYDFDDEAIELNYTPAINELAPNCLRQAGVRAQKFSFKLFGKINMDNDFPLLRLGEMYLIRAEARARLSGNWADAEQDANVIRARAGMSEYAGNLTEAEFLAERGREMFHEATRRTDLIRFGRYNDPWWEKQASEPFRNLFPIPYSAGSDGTLTQNPGY